MRELLVKVTNKKPKVYDATEDPYLNLIFMKNPNINYQKKEGQIVVTKKQNHWTQRFFRKLYFKIPEQTYITLDKYSSFVFEQVDGSKTVREIGQELAAQYDEASAQLYDRLILYLNYLDKEENWIQLVK
ncbi:PqqD family protein [Vagococcus humatus]|uniref:PqqD family protein n=1 Tax=Vagococcus humatus TaxID=1889241 RepID=A0A429Z5L1_9ENTE|nr:PqqD family protein [Vagococcus humatus]